MATKDSLLFTKDKNQSFVSSSIKDGVQYTNLNLNQNNRGVDKTSFIPSESKSKPRNEIATAKVKDSSTFHQEKLQSLKTSSKAALSSNILESLSFNDESKEANKKHWRSPGHSNVNSSTLSLHIAAYENAIEAASGDPDSSSANSKIIKKWKNEINGPQKNFQSPYEFPRNRKDLLTDPEVMQFKASQRLLNPDTSNNHRQQENPSDGAGKEIISYPYQDGFVTINFGQPESSIGSCAYNKSHDEKSGETWKCNNYIWERNRKYGGKKKRFCNGRFVVSRDRKTLKNLTECCHLNETNVKENHDEDPRDDHIQKQQGEKHMGGFESEAENGKSKGNGVKPRLIDARSSSKSRAKDRTHEVDHIRKQQGEKHMGGFESEAENGKSKGNGVKPRLIDARSSSKSRAKDRTHEVDHIRKQQGEKHMGGFESEAENGKSKGNGVKPRLIDARSSSKSRAKDRTHEVDHIRKQQGEKHMGGFESEAENGKSKGNGVKPRLIDSRSSSKSRAKDRTHEVDHIRKQQGEKHMGGFESEAENGKSKGNGVKPRLIDAGSSSKSRAKDRTHEVDHIRKQQSEKHMGGFESEAENGKSKGNGVKPRLIDARSSSKSRAKDRTHEVDHIRKQQGEKHMGGFESEAENGKSKGNGVKPRLIDAGSSSKSRAKDRTHEVDHIRKQQSEKHMGGFESEAENGKSKGNGVKPRLIDARSSSKSRAKDRTHEVDHIRKQQGEKHMGGFESEAENGKSKGNGVKPRLIDARSSSKSRAKDRTHEVDHIRKQQGEKHMGGFESEAENGKSKGLDTSSDLSLNTSALVKLQIEEKVANKIADQVAATASAQERAKSILKSFKRKKC